MSFMIGPRNYNNVIVTVGRYSIIKRNITTITQAQTWAKEHPLLAQKAMTIPTYNSKNDDTNSVEPNKLSSSLDQYLKWRKWDLNTIATNNKNSQLLENDLDDDDDDHMQQMMINLVSHPLTYPLTLGSQLNRFLDNNETKKSSSSLRLCCIGARAEATLPLEYWKEMLIMAIHGNIKGKTTSSLNWEECIIDFIGPDVPKNLPSRTVSISQQSLRNNNNVNNETTKEGEQTTTSWTLRMNYHLDLFHNYIIQKSNDKNDTIDGFILFNPGIGHDYLKKNWKPTMDYILKRNKPILLTAHSDLDVERDWEMLQNEYYHNDGDWNLDEDSYENNLFASRIQYQDPLHNIITTSNSDQSSHPIHLVRPNHKLLFLSKKNKGFTKMTG